MLVELLEKVYGLGLEGNAPCHLGLWRCDRHELFEVITFHDGVGIHFHRYVRYHLILFDKLRFRLRIIHRLLGNQRCFLVNCWDVLCHHLYELTFLLFKVQEMSRLECFHQYFIDIDTLALRRIKAFFLFLLLIIEGFSYYLILLPLQILQIIVNDPSIALPYFGLGFEPFLENSQLLFLSLCSIPHLIFSYGLGFLGILYQRLIFECEFLVQFELELGIGYLLFLGHRESLGLFPLPDFVFGVGEVGERFPSALRGWVPQPLHQEDPFCILDGLLEDELHFVLLRVAFDLIFQTYHLFSPQGIYCWQGS